MAHALDMAPVLGPDLVDDISAALGQPVAAASYVTSGAAGHVFRLTLGGPDDVAAQDDDATTNNNGSARKTLSPELSVQVHDDEPEWGGPVIPKTVIVKTARPERPADFQGEARGLELIACTTTVPTPKVLAVAPEFLVLQDLGINPNQPTDQQWWEFGMQIGKLHSIEGNRFGHLGDDGAKYYDDWVEFFVDNRVRNLFELGRNKEVLTDDDKAGIESIIETIGPKVPPTKPMLCHGDLWWENVYLGADSKLYLIDPAIDYSHPEADLAPTQMYTKFPPAFYEGYRTTKALPGDWETRIPLYQLKEQLYMIAQFAHEGSLNTLRANIRKCRAGSLGFDKLNHRSQMP